MKNILFSYLCFLMFVALAVLEGTATAQTWYYPTSTGSTFNNWVDPENAYSNDGNRAYMVYSSMPGSQDYGFTLPSFTGQNIDGITVSGEIYNNNSAGTSVISVELSWNGGTTWTTTGYQATTSTNWQDVTFSLGGSNNTWGRTWIPAEVTSSTFKARIRTTNGGGIYTTDCDFLRVAFTTSTPEGGGGSTVTAYYVDGVSGNDANIGDELHPFKTLSKVETFLSSTTEGATVYISDTTYFENLHLSNLSGSSNVPYTLDVWEKYGRGYYTINGFKTLGSFTSLGSNLWRITDNDLPADYKTSGGDNYTGYILRYNYLLIDGKPYAESRYPNTGYLQAEAWSTANPATYITDNTAPPAGLSGAFVNGTDEQWGIFRAKASISGNNINLSEFSGDMGSVSDWNRVEYGYKLKYFFSNDPAACDLNGEYAIDPTNHQITVYWDANLNTHELKYSTMVYPVRLENCENFNIRGLKVIGGLQAQVYVKGGNAIDLSGNIFYISPGWSAIIIDGVTGVNLESNQFTKGCNMAINVRQSSNITETGNSIYNYGMDDQMIGDQLDGGPVGINNRDVSGTVLLKNNNVLKTGQHGLAVWVYNNFPASIIIDGNIIDSAMIILNDGAGVYGWENPNRGNYTKEIKNNYLGYCPGNPGFSFNGVSASFGIYLDGASQYWDIYSNVARGGNAGVYFNGTNNNTVRNNLLVFNSTRSDRGAGIKAQETGHYSPTTDCNFYQNSFVITNGLTDWPYDWIDTDGNIYNYGTISDYNHFYEPFTVTGNWAGIYYNWSNLQRTGLSGVRSLLSWDYNSTYNRNGVTFGQVTGINQVDFVKTYYASHSHTFDLGTGLYKDETGQNLSGSLSLGSGESKLLFAVGGDPTTSEEQIFNGLTSFYSPSGETTGTGEGETGNVPIPPDQTNENINKIIKINRIL